MAIQNEARRIYQNITSRCTTSNNLGTSINSATKEYIDIIFKSAAGTNGKLNAEEASAVNRFLEQSGMDLTNIDFAEAEALVTRWQGQATDFLPSITSFDEINQGFALLSSHVNEAKSESIAKRFGYLVSAAVFFNRIIKGRNALGNNTVAMIRRQLDGLMSKPEIANSMPGVKSDMGNFCLTLLNKTSRDADEYKQLHNAFIDKHLSDINWFHKMA